MAEDIKKSKTNDGIITKPFNMKLMIREQLRLAKRVIIKDQLPKEIKLVAGCDVSFVNNKGVAAVVVTKNQDFAVVEKSLSIGKPAIPYLPGFLSYREIPLILRAFSKLRKKPDLVLVDGNGILHPRRIGIASHLGLLLDMPTIGIAKKLLMGSVDEKGFVIVNNEKRGMFLKTRPYAKPVIVSPGFKISLDTAVDIVSTMIRYPHKLPEPLYIAHRISKTYAKRFLEKHKSKD